MIVLALAVLAFLAFALAQCDSDQASEGEATTPTVTQPATSAGQGSTTVQQSTTTASSEATSDTEAVEVTRGDLVINDTMDGTLEETGTIDVVHRIDGQTSSAATTLPAVSGALASASAKRLSQLVRSVPGASPTQSAAAYSEMVSHRMPSSSNASTATSSSTTSTTVQSAHEPGTTTTLVYPAATTTTLVYPAATTTTLVIPEPTTATTTTTTTTCPPNKNAGGGSSSGSGSTGGSGSAGGSGSTGGTGSSATGSSESATGDTTTTVAPTGPTQTVGKIVPVGEEIKSGDVLYTVDGRPVIALTGILPASRTLSADSTDGPDIAQLEEALVALGYDPDGTVVVDEEWTAETTAMVERWQEANKVDPTGVVELGTVVFIDHSATVSEVLVSDGTAIGNGTKVMSLTGSAQLITIAVPSELQRLLAVGSKVTVDGVPATITDLRSAQAEDGPQNIGVQALITPSEPIEAAPGATVEVKIEQVVATDELLVPSDAIVSRRDGTYAVQVAGDGEPEYVTVTIIGTVGSQTAVTSDELTEQSKVLTNQ